MTTAQQKDTETIRAMLRLYCQGHHQQTGQLCSQCDELYRYAANQLSRCPFSGNKPTCTKCTVHCYNSEMKRRVKEVMKYSGPRMLLHHPLMAIRHMVQGLKKPPLYKRKS